LETVSVSAKVSKVSMRKDVEMTVYASGSLASPINLSRVRRTHGKLVYPTSLKALPWSAMVHTWVPTVRCRRDDICRVL
jgi:hypothetical protein